MRSAPSNLSPQVREQEAAPFRRPPETGMSIAFDRSITRNPDEAVHREWLETNGLGGWAGSTILGCNTRRYHGILVAATTPPVGRMVMVSKLDETIEVDGVQHALGVNRYPGAVHPQGFLYLESFTRGIFPEFEYRAGGVRLRKTIAALYGEHTTLVTYEVLEAPQAFDLVLQPFMSPRDYHSLSHANDAIRREAEFDGSVFRVRPYDGVPDVYIGVPGAAFARRPQWYYNFEYDWELERGLDWSEDLFSHGEFRKTLSAGDRLGVIVSLAPPDGRDAFALMRSEADRRAALLGRLPVRDQFSEVLALAADQFVVRRTGNLETLIAGYHWFTDWGRDTMIALPGICLVTGRFEEALGILTTFARSVSEGMLPNRFPDGGEAPEYNTVDATLWFFVAVYRYFLYTGDEAGMREVFMPVLRDIIRWHDRGTRYNIHVTEDGLLYAGEPGVQLTWMDAKVGGLVVTPRKGKAVEVNALWYNALRIYSYLAGSLHLPEESFGERAREVREQFEKVFWNERRGALYDCVDGESRDESVRPNQLFAISLPFPLLEGARAASILRLIRDELLTPVGLRSLSRDNPAYRPVYIGDQWSRDTAYHQGTVWSWLLGPYVTAVMRISGGAAREEARSLLAGIVPRLAEAGAGTVSEIFDGDAPHSARGCIAQAWSVGEILRAYVEDVLGILPPSRNHGKRPEAAEPNRLQFVDARARPS